MEDNTKHTKFWNASNRVWNKILWILMKIGKKNGFYGEEAGESILLQSQNSSEICFIPQVILYSGASSTWDGLYIHTGGVWKIQLLHFYYDIWSHTTNISFDY